MSTIMIITTTAVILSVVYSIPQAVKVYISNVPKAISGFSIIFMVFGSLAWTLYGYFDSNEPILVASLFQFIFTTFILLLSIQKGGVHKPRIAITIALLGIALAISVAYLPKEALAYFGGIVSGLIAIPQGFKLIRQREATGVSGLSYLLLAMSSLCWVIYGHFTENMLVVVPNLLIFPSALLVYINVLKFRANNFWYESIKATQN